MLDKRSQFLLRYINKECSEGSYKIIEINDMLSSFPKKYKIDYDTLAHSLNHLKQREYISIKYYDNDVFCLSPLPRGRCFFEQEIDNKKDKRKIKKTITLLSILYIIFSFLTALLACYLTKYFI